MPVGNSRTIDSNQSGPHDKLTELVQRYLRHPSQRPISEHTLAAFTHCQTWLAGWRGDIILDSCCGVGESTAHIARQYPEAKVIGIDKSAHRIAKHSHYAQQRENYTVLRADVNDFWRLAVQHHWQPCRHYLLYPNPYPKASQVQKRWHACAAFADLLALGGILEVRSNWQIYIQEFAQALAVAGVKAQCDEFKAPQPLTPFERKYWQSGQQSWRTVANLAEFVPQGD